MTTTYRVVWLLKDGRKKYSLTQSGEPEIWTKGETETLKGIIPAFSKDLSVFYAQKFMAISMGITELVDVVGFVLEDSRQPMTEGVLF